MNDTLTPSEREALRLTDAEMRPFTLAYEIATDDSAFETCVRGIADAQLAKCERAIVAAAGKTVAPDV